MASKSAPSASFRPDIRHDATRSPDEEERRKDKSAGEVGQPPGPKHAAELRGRDHVAEPERDDPERGADQRADDRADDECQDVPDTFEVTPPSGQAKEQQRCDDDLERVPDRLAEDRPPRRREVGHEQVACDDPGPEARSPDHECGDANADRRPQRRHASVQVGEMKTSSRRSVVEPGDHADLDRIPSEAPRPRPPPRLQTLEQRSTLFCDRACDRRAQPAVNDRPVGLARKGAGRPPSEGRGVARPVAKRRRTWARHQAPRRPNFEGARPPAHPAGRQNGLWSPTREAGGCQIA